MCNPLRIGGAAPPAMSYAILRLSKLKNLGMATSATQHNYRLQDTPNANPDWAVLNEEHLNHGHRNYWHLANERIAELHLTRLRSDAVRAVELVLTGSPEGFRRDAEGRALDVRGTPWVQDNLQFVRERFGPKNVVSFTLHQDEVTPHIHAVVVPVTTDGRLSNRDVFSPVSLRQLQTDYAKAMAPHGFERGIKYSTAIHEDVRRHYGAQQMSKEALAEVAKRVPATSYQLRPMEPWQNPQGYQAREQLALDLHAAEQAEISNKKISQLAAVASANALEHDRVRVLEKQLAHSQELLVKTREELTTTKEQLSVQQTRADKGHLLHRRAVISQLQGGSLSEKELTWGQNIRDRHQRVIERALAGQLQLPVQRGADLVPVLQAKGYELKVVGPQELVVTHEQDGARFTGAELRPYGRDLFEQFAEAVARTREQGQVAPSVARNEGIEM
jgi:hypothetical protein